MPFLIYIKHSDDLSLNTKQFADGMFLLSVAHDKNIHENKVKRNIEEIGNSQIKVILLPDPGENLEKVFSEKRYINWTISY